MPETAHGAKMKGPKRAEGSIHRFSGLYPPCLMPYAFSRILSVPSQLDINRNCCTVAFNLSRYQSWARLAP